MTKLKEKESAILLRQQGESLKYISEKLNVAKSSVSLWVRDIELSEVAKEKIESSYSNGQLASQAAIKSRTATLLQEARKDAEEMLASNAISKDAALIYCSLLYWCEGAKSKTDNVLTFSNSDPLLVEGYLATLRGSIPIEENKFRVVMHLHDYHDPQAQLLFWSAITKIPSTQFDKTFLKPHTGTQTHPGYPGCIQIKYYDVKIARKVAATARATLKKMIEQSG